MLEGINFSIMICWTKGVLYAIDAFISHLHFVHLISNFILFIYFGVRGSLWNQIFQSLLVVEYLIINFDKPGGRLISF